MAKILLKGSERSTVSGARVVAPANPAERLEVSVLVRRRGKQAMQSRLASVVAGKKIPHLSKEEFAREHGADPQDFAKVRAFAEAQGLKVLQEHAARRTVILSGTVAQFCAAFGVQLHQMSHAGGTYRGRTGGIYLPTEWDGVVEAILGLDNRPQARPRFRSRPATGNIHRRARASAVSYTPPQVAAFYGYPNATGSGQCIGLIELGGGYRPADLSTYFSGLDVSAPSVTAVSVDHATNSPTGDADGPDGEVMLDIEVAGSIAPEARIAVYFGPNTDAGFLDAITTAIHDTTHNPSVISISWGGRGIDLDRAVHDRHGRGVPGRGHHGHQRLRRGGRQRLIGRCQRQMPIMWISPPRARTCSPAAARASWPRAGAYRARPYGTTARAAAPPAAASAVSLPCRPGRRA